MLFEVFKYTQGLQNWNNKSEISDVKCDNSQALLRATWPCFLTDTKAAVNTHLHWCEQRRGCLRAERIPPWRGKPWPQRLSKDVESAMEALETLIGYPTIHNRDTGIPMNQPVQRDGIGMIGPDRGIFHGAFGFCPTLCFRMYGWWGYSLQSYKELFPGYPLSGS